MTSTLINKLRSLKIKLNIVDGKLDVKAPKGVINSILMEEIKAHKDELIDFVNQHKSNQPNYSNIKQVELQADYPLSSAQRRLWILSQFKEESIAYNMPAHQILNGNYHIENLKKAIICTIERHEILRTVFRENNVGEVRQVILSIEELGFEIDYQDFTGQKNNNTLVEQYILNDTAKAFDLENGPLLKAAIFQLADEQYVFYYNMHHIISDGWSMNVLTADVMNYYEAFNMSRLSALDPLHIQYKDYAVWQLNRLEGESASADRAYWLNQFSGELPVIDLSTVKKRPIIRTNNGKSLSTYLSKELTKALTNFCQEREGSLFMGLLASINALFYRYTSQQDFIIGTPLAGRDHVDLENQMGFYLNTIGLRNTVNAEDSFDDLFSRVKKSTFKSYEHQQYPFDLLVEELGLKRDTSRSPVFDIMLILQNTEDKTEGTTVENPDQIIDFGSDVSKYDICFTFKEVGDLISFNITFNTDIYETAFIEGVFNHFKNLLKRMIASPHNQIVAIDYISEEEKNKLLHSFNATAVDYPKESSIIELFAAQVRKNPDGPAVHYQEKMLTYIDVDKLSDQYSAYLFSKLNVRSEDRVVVSLSHNHQLMAVLLAVKKIGAIYIPVDPSTPEERINYIEKDSESVARIDQDVLADMGANYNKEDIHYDVLDAKKSNIEFIIYTSGSTGLPKGILIKSDSVNNRLNWMWKNYPFQEGEVCCAKTSIGFVDHIWEFYGPLLKGIPLFFYKKEEVLNIPEFIKSLNQDKITRIVLVPTLLRELINHAELCHEYLQQLNLWVSSGETLKKRDVEKFYATLRRGNVHLLNIYGSTEVTADATCYDTYAEYNKFKDFKLFDYSLKNEVDKLISSYDVSTKIVAGTLAHLVKNEGFKQVNFGSSSTTDDYLRFLKSELLPNIVNVGATSFVGHMTAGIPNIFRELSSLIVAINQNQVKVETSMISTLIEKQVIGTFHNIVYGQNKTFYEKYVQDSENALGVITNGGTMSNLMALNYTLNKLLGPKDNFRGIKQEGLVKAMKVYGYERVVLLGSNWCHYSFNKSLKLLGLGSEAFISLDYENKDPDQIKQELSSLIELLKEENTLILGLVGIAGTTESGNIDPLNTLAEIAAKYDIHYHVDAAFGGSFLMDDELRKKLDGVQLADSVSICAHKQLYIPIGLSVCLFKDPSFVLFSENNTEYQARKGSFDLGKFTIEGSRNFMSLILHAAFHIFGKEGFAQVVRHNYRTAQYFAGLVNQDTEFDLLYKPDLNIVLYRYIPVQWRNKKQFTDQELEVLNDLNCKIQQEQFSRGNSFISYTKIQKAGNKISHLVFRAVFMNPYTSDKELETMLEEQRMIAASLENRSIVYIPKSKNENISIGKPIENVKVYILDDCLNILPFGITGEICISGDCVAAGYINVTAELTETKFIDNPFMIGERLYKTGDLGRRWPDGNIEYVGRKDDQIKIYGNRVELSEIEHQLQAMKNITDAVVLFNEMPDGSYQLVAYIVSVQKENIADLRKYLAERLPSYMVPSHFMQLDEMPLTSSGKINKKALPQLEDAGMITGLEFISPRNAYEQLLFEICKPLLKKDYISMNDSFYHIGGDSIKLIRLLSGLRKAGYHIRPELILQAPDLAAIAKLMEREEAIAAQENNIPAPLVEAGEYSEKTALKVGELISVSENQKKMMKMASSQGIIGPFVIPELDKGTLGIEFRKFLTQFPSLNIQFVKHNEDIFQQFVNPEEVKLLISYKNINLAKKTDVKDEEKHILEIPYDFFNGELIRAYVFTDINNEKKPLLYLAISHALTDLYTNNVLAISLVEFLRSQKLSITQRVFSNSHFTVWQEKYLKSAEGVEARNFWLNNLKSMNLTKPKDNFFIGVQSESGWHYVDQIQLITGRKFEAIKTLSKDLNISISVAFMSYHQILIREIFGDTIDFQMVIVNGRDNVTDGLDTTQVLGVINNYLPMKMANKKDIGFYDEVNVNYVYARQNQSIPYEVIRKDFLAETRNDLDSYTSASINFQQLPGSFDLEQSDELIIESRYSTQPIYIDLTCKLKDNGVQLSLTCPIEIYQQFKETTLNLENSIQHMASHIFVSETQAF